MATPADIGRYTPHLLAGGQVSACQSRLRADLDEHLGRAEQIARRATGDRVASVIAALRELTVSA